MRVENGRRGGSIVKDVGSCCEVFGFDLDRRRFFVDDGSFSACVVAPVAASDSSDTSSVSAVVFACLVPFLMNAMAAAGSSSSGVGGVYCFGMVLLDWLSFSE
ncbi:MAG: hypothetical protein R3C28_11130, partial [Pirellulaceae bacterium]